jgi:hypothetical protein
MDIPKNEGIATPIFLLMKGFADGKRPSKMIGSCASGIIGCGNTC